MRKKKQVNRLISSVIFSLVALSALSQAASNGRPTLIVGITIDQLRSDYLQLLQSHFGENGFKRLMRDGVYIENAVFRIADANKITSTALLYSGAFPNVTGITGEKTYDKTANKASDIFNDPKYIGNTTDETYSPVGILGIRIRRCRVCHIEHVDGRAFSEFQVVDAVDGKRCNFFVD